MILKKLSANSLNINNIDKVSGSIDFTLTQRTGSYEGDAIWDYRWETLGTKKIDFCLGKNERLIITVNIETVLARSYETHKYKYSRLLGKSIRLPQTETHTVYKNSLGDINIQYDK